MSCIVTASPFLLLFSVIDIAAREKAENKEIIKEIVEKALTEGHITKEEVELITREYETAFMSEDVLLKTLEEHGIDDLEINENKITCKNTDFNVEFYRADINEPYKMKISCNQECKDGEFVSDVKEEYEMNVQEETYLKIKDRLEKKHLKIDSEEVLEDNSIMLTINLD